MPPMAGGEEEMAKKNRALAEKPSGSGSKLKRKDYDKELARLHVELV